MPVSMMVNFGFVTFDEVFDFPTVDAPNARTPSTGRRFQWFDQIVLVMHVSHRYRALRSTLGPSNE